MKFLINFLNKYLIKLIILMIIVNMVRNIYTNLNSNHELVEAQNELDRLKAENQELEAEINILDTKEYVEFVARSELGLVKKNEVVLVLPEDKFLESLAKIDEQKVDTKNIPNWQKWKSLLF